MTSKSLKMDRDFEKQKQHTIFHFILVIFLLTPYASYGTMYTVFSKLQILLVQKVRIRYFFIQIFELKIYLILAYIRPFYTQSA